MSGSHPKAPGFAGGYLLRHPPCQDKGGGDDDMSKQAYRTRVFSKTAARRLALIALSRAKRGFAKPALPGRNFPQRQIARKRLEFKAIGHHLAWFLQIAAMPRGHRTEFFGPFCLRCGGRGRILRFRQRPTSHAQVIMTHKFCYRARLPPAHVHECAVSATASSTIRADSRVPWVCGKQDRRRKFELLL